MIGYIGTVIKGELVDEERFDDFYLGSDSTWEEVPGHGVFNCTKREAPFQSWVFNKRTGKWEAPAPMPDDGQMYTWNESTTSWELVDPIGA